MKKDAPEPVRAAGEGPRIGTKRFRPLWWGLLILFVALLFLAVDVSLFLTSPGSGRRDPVIIDIPVGTSVPSLCDLLEQRGVVRSGFRFRLYARLKGETHRIKAGEYEFSPSLRPDGVLSKLVRGEVFLHQITFPEGTTIHDVAALLAARGLAGAEEVLAAATDRTLARELGIPASTVEGYCFPDTYRFARHLPAATIIRTMVARFNQYFGPTQEEQAQHLGLTRHQVVILASIVEKETGAAAERPLIAGVFLNRLRRGMPLQSDPTVIYGVANFDGNLTRVHLLTDTPYNTYTRPGLPAGPVANPGAGSLDAVLSPAATPYLYFVAKGDGTHQFSATLHEHNAAVAHYQLHR
ncbi:MAG TPA: endolytic transglycosylase MltG [Syntrophobacteria bacterium]|nr:endolytic transglycosylase MltG [Syntrophobacteria bacterium]